MLPCRSFEQLRRASSEAAAQLAWSKHPEISQLADANSGGRDHGPSQQWCSRGKSCLTCRQQASCGLSSGAKRQSGGPANPTLPGGYSSWSAEGLESKVGCASGFNDTLLRALQRTLEGPHRRSEGLTGSADLNHWRRLEADRGCSRRLNSTEDTSYSFALRIFSKIARLPFAHCMTTKTLELNLLKIRGTRLRCVGSDHPSPKTSAR